MQSVADNLGIDRSTINFHFNDRDDLFSSIAAVKFAQELEAYSPPDSSDWRDWVRAYASAVHNALLEHPELIEYMRLSLGMGTAAFEPIEGLIAKLQASGFNEAHIMQSITFMSEAIHSAARNEVLAATNANQQGAELLKFLSEQPENTVPGIRRLIALNPIEQPVHFHFSLQMLIAGMESLLD
jgi:AcrR family transcriptional regulator